MRLKGAFKKVKQLFSNKAVAVAAVLAIGAISAGVSLQPVRADRPDCDSNAVMYCGAFNTGDLQNKYASNSSTRAIYASAPFGISSNEFYGSLGSLQSGAVYKNGNVVVGGRVVATGALTAGRGNIAGSTPLPSAPGYYRAPSVSFKQNSLQAYVKLDANGQFQFAIIKACGNPVTGHPTPPPAKPSFSIEKKVKLAYTSNPWAETITVKPGERVEYVIAVTNTGNVTLNNMMVRDQLPASMTYLKGSTYMITSYAGQKSLPDGVTGRGINIGNMPAKGVAYVFFKADAPKASNTNLKICETGEKSVLHNTAYAKPTGLPEKNNGADVLTCRPGKPSFEIEKKVKIAGTKDEFTENVVADPGTLLEFAVAVTNTGNIDLKNMVVTDALPKGLTYKPNTTRLVTSTGTNKTLPDSPSLFYKGVTISVMKPSEVAFIIFQAYLPKADSTEVAVKECETGKTKLVNIAKAKPAGLTTKQDDASAETCKETPKPNFVMQKDIRKVGQTTWQQDVTVNYGDSVEYRILVKNTGDTALKDVVVTDTQPVGVDFVSGSVRVNGQSVANGDNLFTSGVTIPEIKKGGQAEVTFTAKLMGQPDPCETKAFKNIASAKPTGLQPKTDDANVTANCKFIEKPKVKIEKRVNKTVVDVNGQFVYTLDVTNTGNVELDAVKVTDPAPKGVNFLSSSKPAGTTVNVTATNFEAVIAKLAVGQKVTFEIQSKVIKEVVGKITNTACVDAPKIPGNPDDCDTVDIETPSYDCTSLASLNLGDFRYRFTPQIVKSSTVTLTGVTYDFGDGSAQVVRPDANPVEHTFEQKEEKVAYTITATVVFNVDGVAQTRTCKAQVEISEIPQTPCPYNPNLPKDDPRCVEPCPYNPELPKNDPNCVKDVCPEIPGMQTNPKDCEETPPPVTVIPSTGAGDIAGSVAGLSGAAYGAASLISRRRVLKGLRK